MTIQRYQSHAWGDLAKELGLDKKELLSLLPAWFQREDKGKAAFKAFSATVHADQERKGLELLVEVFQLTVNEVRKTLFEAAGFIPAIEKEFLRFAHLAGKPKLVQLSTVLKAKPHVDQLKTLVTVEGEVEGKLKLLIELAATGTMESSLKALGVPAAQDPLVAGVTAVEAVLQSPPRQQACRQPSAPNENPEVQREAWTRLCCPKAAFWTMLPSLLFVCYPGVVTQHDFF